MEDYIDVKTLMEKDPSHNIDGAFITSEQAKQENFTRPCANCGQKHTYGVFSGWDGAKGADELNFAFYNFCNICWNKYMTPKKN
jgi:hypothetical protein